MSSRPTSPQELRLETIHPSTTPAGFSTLAAFFWSCVIAAFVSVASCSSGQPSSGSTPGAAPTVTPTSLPSATSSSPRGSPTPGLSQISLRVWVPPEFGISAVSANIAEIVAGFEEAHPGIKVEVSAKQAVGKGSLLDLLHGASQVAPGYAPDLVLMDDVQMPQAAAQGLLQPLESLLPDQPGDRVFANLLAAGVSEGVRYATPFAMDFLHLAYRVSGTSTVPMNWANVLESGGRYLFASGASGNYSSDSILIQYLGLDGLLTDSRGKAALDSRILTRVLDAYKQMDESGTLADESLTLNSPGGAWSLYKLGEATFVEVWASQFMAEASSIADTAFMRIPTRNGRAATLAHVWAWSITARDPERQQAAASFLQWVLEPSAQRTWSQAAGFLPSAPQAWPLASKSTEYNQFALDLARQASPLPAALRSAGVSAALQEALSQVITASIPAKQAAEQAIAKMGLQ